MNKNVFQHSYPFSKPTLGVFAPGALYFVVSTVSDAMEIQAFSFETGHFWPVLTARLAGYVRTKSGPPSILIASQNLFLLSGSSHWECYFVVSTVSDGIWGRPGAEFGERENISQTKISELGFLGNKCPISRPKFLMTIFKSSTMFFLSFFRFSISLRCVMPYMTLLQEKNPYFRKNSLMKPFYSVRAFARIRQTLLLKILEGDGCTGRPPPQILDR